MAPTVRLDSKSTAAHASAEGSQDVERNLVGLVLGGRRYPLFHARARRLEVEAALGRSAVRFSTATHISRLALIIKLSTLYIFVSADRGISTYTNK